MSELRIQRAYDIDPARLFAFVTEAENLIKWWGPEGAAASEVKLDLTRPGPWALVLETPRGPFEIQIGAYADSAEAERSMAAARERTGALLDAYRSVTIPVQNGKLYRARFRGFDATAANTTCSRLKTMQIDCFVTRTE